MRLLVLFFMLAIVPLSSCRKCINKPIGKTKCPKAFYMVKGLSTDLAYGHHLKYDEIHYHRIDSQKEFERLTRDDTLGGYLFRAPSLTIDFRSQTLLGISLTTNPGNEIDNVMYLCKRQNTEDDYTLNIKYSLHDQCEGSGITDYPVNFWMVVPKIQASAIVNYDVEDINPFY